jgi:hypothetical protein
MTDEIKLIYFYRLDANGFRTGDKIDHEDYRDIINTAINHCREYFSMKYKLQEVTPKLMSEIILDWIVGEKRTWTVM